LKRKRQAREWEATAEMTREMKVPRDPMAIMRLYPLRWKGRSCQRPPATRAPSTVGDDSQTIAQPTAEEGSKVHAEVHQPNREVEGGDALVWMLFDQVLEQNACAEEAKAESRKPKRNRGEDAIEAGERDSESCR
jgi:hypothetical protein